MHKKRYRVDVVRGFSKSFLTKKFSTKKGQITIFIILGILLLLALVLVIFLKKEVLVFKPEEIVPTTKGKVESLITSCIDDISEDALFLIGLQGGYINVPEEIASDSSVHLRISPMNVVPYWAYGTNNEIQTLDQIKQRIDFYIEENLRECVLGLEPFKEVYDITEKSGIAANTEIVESKVIFNVYWNLEIKDKAGEVITELINHVTESPVRLKNVHATAKRIVEQELSGLKLEDLTLDLIALEHPNVPVAGMELSCSKKTWKVKEVKETLQDLLRINIGQLKVKGTEFVEFPEDLPYFQNHYIWEMGDEFIQPEVSVVFNYENNYPFLFQVTPTSGGMMESGSSGGNDKLSFLCIQQWKFTYDVTYPVLVRVRDETTGYNFNAAFTVHLVRNKPDRESYVTARPSLVYDFASDDKFCGDKRVPMTVRTWNLIENAAQGIYDAEPLEDVEVSYTCMRYRCEMGKTEFDFAQAGYQAGLNLNFPYCVGGILRGQKEGFKETWERVTTKAGGEADLYLVPLFKLPVSKFSVVKHDVTGESMRDAAALGKDETALIRLNAYKEGQKFHTVEQMVGKGLNEETAQQLQVELLADADFTYEVEVNVFDDESMIGGYSANWTASWDELQSAEKIVFHALTREGAGDIAIYDLISNLKKYSQSVPLPEIIVGGESQ